jgi:hypothetical protein
MSDVKETNFSKIINIGITVVATLWMGGIVKYP